MGREIRKVPPNWNHPRDERGNYQSMFDETIASAFSEWLSNFDNIRANGVPEDEKEYYPLGLVDWLKDNTPPDPAYYRPWQDEEATWFQVWETVSEGSPVTPPFATKEELVEYLVANGDFWDQKRGKGGYSREAAQRFVESEYAPSFVISDGVLRSGIEAA